MRRTRRLAVTTLAVVTSLAAVPAVVVAESITGELIRELNNQLLYIAVPIAVLVEVILFYAVWRFRDADEPVPTRKNRELEITWTVATALMLLFVGTASFAVLAHPLVAASPGDSHGTTPNGGGAVGPGDAPPEAVEVIVVAEQWEYTFLYPDADVVSEDVLVLPTSRPVYIWVTSKDVLHSVHIPELGLKQDAFPGGYNLIRTRLLDPGEHRLYCAEYCGARHATMVEPVRVVPPDRFESWLADRRIANASHTVTKTNETATTPEP